MSFSMLTRKMAIPICDTMIYSLNEISNYNSISLCTAFWFTYLVSCVCVYSSNALESSSFYVRLTTNRARNQSDILSSWYWTLLIAAASTKKTYPPQTNLIDTIIANYFECFDFELFEWSALVMSKCQPRLCDGYDTVCKSRKLCLYLWCFCLWENFIRIRLILCVCTEEKIEFWFGWLYMMAATKRQQLRRYRRQWVKWHSHPPWKKTWNSIDIEHTQKCKRNPNIKPNTHQKRIRKTHKINRRHYTASRLYHCMQVCGFYLFIHRIKTTLYAIGFFSLSFLFCSRIRLPFEIRFFYSFFVIMPFFYYSYSFCASADDWSWLSPLKSLLLLLKFVYSFMFCCAFIPTSYHFHSWDWLYVVLNIIFFTYSSLCSIPPNKFHRRQYKERSDLSNW